MFRGEYHQRVDGKGRVSIPALFRRVIEAGDPDWKDGLRPNLVLVYGTEFHKRIDGFTMQAIEEIDRRIHLMKKGSEDRKMLERIYHGHSFPTQIDEDGRIILPQKLREKLGLTDAAYFIGASDRFELWKPETFEALEGAKVDAWLAGQEEGFDPDLLLPDLPDEP